MGGSRIDRRVQRTRQLLRGALIDLIKEKGYDDVTIEDITERANVGRTTFYLHYASKEDLLLEHHDMDIATHFRLGIFSRTELMDETIQPEMSQFLELMSDNRRMYHAIRSAKDSANLLRRVREQIAANFQSSLQTIFPNSQPNVPLDLLTEYVVGAELSLINWWMTTRTTYDAAQVAAMLHRFQRAAVCDAYS